MIEKWVIFKRDYLEISFLRENCGYDGSDERRRCNSWSYTLAQVLLLFVIFWPNHIQMFDAT